LFLRDATLFAWRFDPESRTLQGDPRPIAEQLQITTRLSGGTGAFSVSSNGTLVYQTGVGVRSQLTWVDRRGQTLRSVGEQADLVDVRLSPDGTVAAVSRLDPLVGTRDIWTYNLVRNLAERFTTEPSDEYAPVWSPPGDRIAFTSTRDGSIQIFEQPRDRSAPPRKVDAGKSPLGKFAAAWSPDGRSLLFIAGGRALARSDLHQVPMHEGGVSAPLLESPFIETQVRFSPDGRWIAYASNDTGPMEVYVRPFPLGGTPTRVSLQGGGWPAWRKDGREIFFLSLDGSMMAVTVSLDGNLRIDEPRRLFNVRLRPMGRLDAYSYDVTGDGQQFLMNTFVEEATSTGLTLLVNWPAAVR
jgi:Tol biopolymer transport system component